METKAPGLLFSSSNLNPSMSLPKLTQLACRNCNESVSEELADEHHMKLSQFGHSVEADWCSPECYLSYHETRISLYAFVKLRTDVSNAYNRSVRESPPRTQLKGWGGPLSQAAYHRRTESSSSAPRSTAVRRVVTHSKH